MKLKRRRARALNPLSMPVVVVVLYTGLMSMIVYQVKYSLHALSPVELYLRIGSEVWPLARVQEGAAALAALMIVWLWVEYRSRPRPLGLVVALPYVGSALLLIWLQRALAAGLAEPPVVGTLELIHP